MKKNYKIIAGVDEVGRGAFAGPLVAGCVILEKSAFGLPPSVFINDSKKLTARQREVASIWIKENALAWGIGIVSAKFIDKNGLTKAGNRVFRKAILSAQKKLGRNIDTLIIDAFYVPYLKGIPRKKQFAIVGADSKSASVAAASIIAKVYRDKLMTDLGKKSKYKKYSWDKNKGYGTKDHRAAIKNFGQTSYHRKLFLRKMSI